MKSLFYLLCGCITHCTAQNLPLPTVSGTGRATSPGRVVLKLAPFTLLEPQNTAEVAIEVPLRDRFSLQAQFGYAPHWLAASLSEGHSIETYTQREYWRVRLEPRWYVEKNRRGTASQSPLGRYVAIDMLYKQLNASKSVLLGHQCVGINCASYEGIQQRVARYAVALGVKLGWQSALGHQSEGRKPRWLLDWYVGAGLRYAWSAFATPTLLPSDQFGRSGNNLMFDPFKADNALIPSLLLGVKLGYTL